MPTNLTPFSRVMLLANFGLKWLIELRRLVYSLCVCEQKKEVIRGPRVGLRTLDALVCEGTLGLRVSAQIPKEDPSLPLQHSVKCIYTCVW